MQENTDQKNSEYGHFLRSVLYVWRVNETQYKVKITLKKFSFQIYTEFFQTIIEFDIGSFLTPDLHWSRAVTFQKSYFYLLQRKPLKIDE